MSLIVNATAADAQASAAEKPKGEEQTTREAETSATETVSEERQAVRVLEARGVC